MEDDARAADSGGTRLSRAAWIALFLAAALIVIEAASLVARGARGASDISVYYRTCHLLRDGVGAAIYPRNDAGTGWPISMPPIGFAVFQPFSVLSPAGASLAWAVFNVVLLAVIVVTLRSLSPTTSGGGRGGTSLGRMLPWATALLAALAAASVQVGQFSVLFVACWVLFVHAFSRGWLAMSAVWLAIPAAIKIYPAMLVAAPLSTYVMSVGRPGDRLAGAARYVLYFAGAIIALWFAAPALAYGTQTWALNLSWLQHVILNNAQMDYLQSLRAITNQSLDTVLLRYLSYDATFHDRYHAIPHLAIDKHTVLQMADATRVLILLITSAVVWNARRTTHPGTFAGSKAWNAIALTALWSSVLYLIVPEIKSRYAVYLFIAFLPWLADAADPSATAAARRVRTVAIVILVILALVLLPEALQAWGVGLLGPLILWIGNMRFVSRLSWSSRWLPPHS